MEHVGKKIREKIEESPLSFARVSRLMNTSYQNLNKLCKKESVETKYLFLIAEILDIPVTSFFNDDALLLSRKLDEKEYHIEELHRHIDKLEYRIVDKAELEKLHLEMVEIMTIRASKKNAIEEQLDAIIIKYKEEVTAENEDLADKVKQYDFNRKKGIVDSQTEVEAQEAKKILDELFETRYRSDPRVKMYFEERLDDYRLNYWDKGWIFTKRFNY